MELKLEKPIIFFDLETTGIDIARDRIVEISILKIFPNGNKESKTWLVNPEIIIPESSIAIHGITNEKVANEPTFKEIVLEVNTLIEGCDFAGFNSNRFDIPILAEEMLRADVEFSMEGRVAIDVQTIFHKMEQRNLSAAYKFYCNKSLENAHSAEADTLATYEVLLGQLDKYEELENNVQFLSEFSSHRGRADFAGFILYDEDNDEIFSFGKYKGKKVTDILSKDFGYYGWILNADFPLYTKQVLKTIKFRMNQVEAPKKDVDLSKPPSQDQIAELQKMFNKKL
ncbi:MAG TPA: 3'-5' exonuclease [Flavobacteriaceae bacterium]|nr:3'-5' exonuclease [Flavobacteriaceae bacterium]HEX5743733.1 3'-5' exonuclease [Flavobacteriaceae bacterium]